MKKIRKVEKATYEEFIGRKMELRSYNGLEIDESEIPNEAFPHQRDLIRWALRKGRSAIFADTGLGKTLMELTWAKRVSREGRVLILTPLAVAEQTVREGRKWGVEVSYSKEDDNSPIVVTNYERLGNFNPDGFAGVVLDESSILKAYDGKTRTTIIESFSKTPFRLAATATPAPNDFTELGNHSEFLGVKTRTEMLAEYFVHDGGSTQNWRLKGHAVTGFWKWISSWGAVVRLPSDLGYDDHLYNLPPLRMHDHLIPVDYKQAWKSGRLFPDLARTISEQRDVRRATMDERIAKANEIVAGVDQAIIWCELNAEGDALTKTIKGSVQVKGSDSPELKAENLNAFAEKKIRVLITKPSIAGFGVNWQNCHIMVFVGASHSYEQTYQAIRRCWRFGQTHPVDVHIISAETETMVVENFRRKEADAARLAAEMAAQVGDSVRSEVQGSSRREWNPYEPKQKMEIPGWL